MGDLHVVLGLIHHRELKQSAHVTQNFRKRGPRFWTLGVSLWTLLSGDQGELRSCVAEISLDDALDVHRYLSDMKHDSAEFKAQYEAYKAKYTV